MKTPTDPLKFFSVLKWLDGRPLLDVVEPYRQRVFSEALYTLDDGIPRYNLILAGRAKKNWKSADLVLAALYRLLAWPSPNGAQCYILANDMGQAGDDLELCKKIVKANKILKEELKAKSDSRLRRSRPTDRGLERQGRCNRGLRPSNGAQGLYPEGIQSMVALR